MDIVNVREELVETSNVHSGVTLKAEVWSLEAGVVWRGTLVECLRFLDTQCPDKDEFYKKISTLVNRYL